MPDAKCSNAKCQNAKCQMLKCQMLKCQNATAPMPNTKLPNVKNRVLVLCFQVGMDGRVYLAQDTRDEDEYGNKKSKVCGCFKATSCVQKCTYAKWSNAQMLKCSVLNPFQLHNAKPLLNAMLNAQMLTGQMLKCQIHFNCTMPNVKL